MENVTRRKVQKTLPHTGTRAHELEKVNLFTFFSQGVKNDDYPQDLTLIDVQIS